MKHILVTGGAGYLGTTLIPELVAAGYRVTVLDRFFFGDEPLKALSNVNLRLGDIRRVDTSLFENVDVVIDLAGLSNDPTCDLDPELTTAINHHGSVKVAEMAAQAGVERYILSSSCAVYGHNTATVDDSSTPNPLTRYAQAKLAAEREVLALNEQYDDTSFTVLRTGTVFGLSQRMRFDLVVNLMSQHAFLRSRVFVMGTGQHWRPLVHVHDVSRAFLLVAEKELAKVRGQIFNVGDDTLNYRVVTIAYQVKSVLPDTNIEMLHDDPERRDYRVSFRKIHETLGFCATRSVEDGVREVIDALRNGTLVPDDRRWYTVRFYRFLLEAEQMYKQFNMDGSILR